jgi:tol-pal system protein YbgF
MPKSLAGLLAILLFFPFSYGQDKSKKAYELIYEDVQAIKKQLASLEEKLDRSAAEIESLKAQVRDLQALVRLLQSDQTSVQQGIKNVPSQYQFLLDKIEQVNQLLAKISEDLLTMKGGSGAAGPEPEAKEKEAAPSEKKPAGQKPPPPPTEKKPAPVTPTSLSPQEVYNMAYADYLKGNFDLASDGFKIYLDNFPDSPLADNALYWIGECLFSQRKFNEAVEQFDNLILEYPQGDKVAAAYLKKGLALVELRRKDEALVVFKLLTSKYPLEEEARIGQEKIKELAPK